MNEASLTAPICVTCGTQYPPAPHPPSACPICEDERQYVGLNGQQWTTLRELQQKSKNQFFPMEPGVTAIKTDPAFAIGQRAFLIETPEGNVLWDCVTLLDDDTQRAIEERGGIALIAISHPHYYSSMIDWSDAFNAPVYLHAADRQWVMRSDERIRFWEGESLPLHQGMTLIRGGGHFEGGAMLHVPSAASGKGALFSGDIIQVVPDRRWVSFMYSYPNYIPLSEREALRVASTVEPYQFDKIYGAFHPMQVEQNGREVVRKSVERYVRFLRA